METLAKIRVFNTAGADWAPWEYVEGIGRDYVRHLVCPLITGDSVKAAIFPEKVAQTLVEYWQDEFPVYKFKIIVICLE